MTIINCFTLPQLLILPLITVVFLANNIQAQLWQMNSVPFIYRDRSPPIVVPGLTTPRPGSRAAETTLRGEFKWVALIESRFRFPEEVENLGPLSLLEPYRCGATLIGQQWILTAAHCVKQKGVMAESITIWLGRYNLSDVNEAGTDAHTVTSNNIVVHPLYSSLNPSYNYAMIKLLKPIPRELSATIAPIELPQDNYCTKGYNGYSFPVDSCQTVATTAGWGSFEAPTVAQLLQKTTVPLYYYNSCNAWRTARVYQESTICGGGMTWTDVCLGDRGSALMCRDANFDKWYLLGMALNGDPNCANRLSTDRLPAVYGRICAVLPFIKATIAIDLLIWRNVSSSATASTARATQRPTTTTTTQNWITKTQPWGNEAPADQNVQTPSPLPAGIMAALANQNMPMAQNVTFENSNNFQPPGDMNPGDGTFGFPQNQLPNFNQGFNETDRPTVLQGPNPSYQGQGQGGSAFQGSYQLGSMAQGDGEEEPPEASGDYENLETSTLSDETPAPIYDQ